MRQTAPRDALEHCRSGARRRPSRVCYNAIVMAIAFKVITG